MRYTRQFSPGNELLLKIVIFFTASRKFFFRKSPCEWISQCKSSLIVQYFHSKNQVLAGDHNNSVKSLIATSKCLHKIVTFSPSSVESLHQFPNFLQKSFHIVSQQRHVLCKLPTFLPFPRLNFSKLKSGPNIFIIFQFNIDFVHICFPPLYHYPV